MVAGLLLWLALVVGGTIEMIRYSKSPGVAGSAPGVWPGKSRLLRDPARPTLVMFLHPRCPCSRASVRELESLLARVDGKVTVCVAFVKSSGSGTEWERTDLWRQVEAIGGARLYADEAGAEARLFRAETSGHTVLYDSAGVLQFQGGITIARGHSGDNAGRSALEDILLRSRSNGAQTPVFGCALFDGQCRTKERLCKP